MEIFYLHNGVHIKSEIVKKEGDYYRVMFNKSVHKKHKHLIFKPKMIGGKLSLQRIK